MNVRRNKILTSASRAFESSDHPANSFLGVIVAGLSGVRGQLYLFPNLHQPYKVNNRKRHVL